MTKKVVLISVLFGGIGALATVGLHQTRLDYDSSQRGDSGFEAYLANQQASAQRNDEPQSAGSQEQANSAIAAPALIILPDFTTLHRLYHTSMTRSDVYAAPAFLSHRSDELCGEIGNAEGLCLSDSLEVVPPDQSPNVSVRNRLYDLRGKPGCFIVVKEGTGWDIRIVNAFPGPCDRDNLVKYGVVQD